MATVKEYTVVRAFELNGRIVAPDETVGLSRKQAKYLLLAGKVAEATAAKTKKTKASSEKEA